MRVHDLGALAITVEAVRRPVAGARAPALLALLAIHANERVSVDALIDAAWGDQVTPGAPSTLESHVWRLRQFLEPGRPRRQPPAVLVNDAGGYRLVVGACDLDSLLVAQLASEVGDLLAADHAHSAIRRADEALALWRGQPYGPLSDRDWARPATARLDEVHGQLRERRVEALLATGDLDRALSDLEWLVAALPYRESLRGLQMVALHRGGRSDEALAVFQRTRRTLLDEVGTEPGRELQELHRRILNDDPTLTGRERRTRSVRNATEVHLPAPLTTLIGRDDVVRRLALLVVEQRLVTVTGAAGCGKTRVAVGVARSVADTFPDGVWFVDLTAVEDPDLVVDVVVSTIGITAGVGATPLENVAAYLRARRMLLVLDNCEHVLTGVARIVSAALGAGDSAIDCSILAASREPIGVDAEAIWTLDPLALPAPDGEALPQAAPAVALFLERVAAAVPTLSIDDHVVARAVEICAAVDGLPLPIELAAARARTYTLDELVGQVRDDPGRLSRVGRGPADHRATVRSSIEWSHRMLSPSERVAHRRMSVLPGRFVRETALAVIGDGVDVDDLLAQLVHRSMLVSDGSRHPGGPTRFRQLATIRAHATRSLADAGETSDALNRRDAWTSALLTARPRLGRPEEIAWYAALDDSYTTVRATLARHLLEEPTPVGGRLAHRLQFYWYYRAGTVEATRWLQRGRDVVGGGDPADVALATGALASVLLVQGRVDEAHPHVNDLVAHLTLVDADRRVEVGETMVGLAGSAWLSDAVETVVLVHDHLAQIADEAGDVDLQLLTDAIGCVATVARGHPEQAAEHATQVYERAIVVGNVMAAWLSAATHMLVDVLAGRPDRGIPWVNRAIRGHAQLGLGGGGLYIENRANFAAMAGDLRTAARVYALARLETRRSGMVWPRRPLTQELLDDTRQRLGSAAFDAEWREGERMTIADLVRLDGEG